MEIEMIEGNLLNPDGSVNENTMARLEGAIDSVGERSPGINDPEWSEKLWTFKKEVTSKFAACAVRASPYAYPENLEKVTGYLDACISGHFREIESMAQVSLNEIHDMLMKCLMDLPMFVAWNDRKNGRDGNGYASRYSGKSDPDDDFIDLHALIRNVCIDIRTERREFKAFNDKFDKDHPGFKREE